MWAVRIPPVTPGLPSDILNQRPDVRSAEAQLASANHSVESARAAFFPTIQLTGQNGFREHCTGIAVWAGGLVLHLDCGRYAAGLRRISASRATRAAAGRASSNSCNSYRRSVLIAVQRRRAGADRGPTGNNPRAPAARGGAHRESKHSASPNSACARAPSISRPLSRLETNAVHRPGFAVAGPPCAPACRREPVPGARGRLASGRRSQTAMNKVERFEIDLKKPTSRRSQAAAAHRLRSGRCWSSSAPSSPS